MNCRKLSLPQGVTVVAALAAASAALWSGAGYAQGLGAGGPPFIPGPPIVTGQRPAAAAVSINSTSENRDDKPRRAVREQAIVPNRDYTVIGINDLGMHCGDLDTRLLSILPPFNVLHAQVIRKGPEPAILTDQRVRVAFSAASSRFDAIFDPANPQPPGFDIVGGGAPFDGVYKTNFWDTVNAGAYNPFYPFDIVPPPIPIDLGLIVPDPAVLPGLVADQQAMPGIRVPYVQNDAERFARFDTDLPFFANFPFGYTQTGLNWFSADGVPITTFDDFGRVNPYPLMRVTAVDKNRPNRVLASVDTVMPVSGEADCRNCHTSNDPSNGVLGGAIVGPGGGLPVATAFDDPLYGELPLAVSVEYAQDLNVLRFHDRNRTLTNSNNYTDTAGNPIPCEIDAANPNGNENCLTNKALVQGEPVVCQVCHYTPALDLAQVGPLGGSLLFDDTSGLTNANGRAQRNKPTMSRAIHRRAHGTNGRFSPFEMPPPNLQDLRNQVVTAEQCVFNPATGLVGPAGGFAAGRCNECAERGLTVAQCAVENTCYQCHPGTFTKCLRGAMGKSDIFCQDCHGDMEQVGNDFSVAFSSAYPFGSPEAAAAGAGLRIPWGEEPGCQSCHVGDAVNQPADRTGFVYAEDGIRLLQAWTPVAVDPVVIDGTQFQPASTLAQPISSPNSRFAEDEIDGKRVLYRLSKGSRRITLDTSGLPARTGHRGVFCQACHGSTHAEWPVTPDAPNGGAWPPPEGSFVANDNVTAGQLQGHTGTIIECNTCHKGDFNVQGGLGGPHGMHPVGGKDSTGYSQWWVNNHRNVLGENPSLQTMIDRCGVCHGVEGQGTVLSVMRQDRTLIRFGGRAITINAGDQVACTTCHTRGNPMAPAATVVASQ